MPHYDKFYWLMMDIQFILFQDHIINKISNN